MPYRVKNLLQLFCTALLLPAFGVGISDAESCDIVERTDQLSALQVFLDIDSNVSHNAKQPQQVQTNSSFARIGALLQVAGHVADQATASAVATLGAAADMSIGPEEEEDVLLKVHEHTPHLGVVVLVGVGLALTIAYCMVRGVRLAFTAANRATGGLDSGGDNLDEEEVENRTFQSFDEDTYRLAIVLLVRDGQFLAKGQGASALRVTRIIGHVGLLLVTIVIQIVLLNQIKWLVTPQAVTTIRTAYDQYELQMCGGVESHTTLTVNGKHRCKPQYFQPDVFMRLDDGLKAEVCNIPLSQLRFFKLVLLIWSLTCIGQMKMCCETFVTITVATPSCESMAGAVVPLHEANASKADNEEPGPEKVIQALTVPMKAVIVFTVLLPWLMITCNLLAQGSRWLTATNDFGELILNAVGLEFVLLLKDLVYHTIVAARNKRELRNTLFCPTVKKEPAGYFVFMGGFIWGALAVIWVYVYIFHLQTVLPEYKWDVHASCTRWLQSLTVKPNLTALRAAGLGSL